MVDYILVHHGRIEDVSDAGIARRDQMDVDSDHHALWAVIKNPLVLKQQNKNGPRRPRKTADGPRYDRRKIRQKEVELRKACEALLDSKYGETEDDTVDYDLWRDVLLEAAIEVAPKASKNAKPHKGRTWAPFCYQVIGFGRGYQGLELVSYAPSRGPVSALGVS